MAAVIVVEDSDDDEPQQPRLKMARLLIKRVVPPKVQAPAVALHNDQVHENPMKPRWFELMAMRLENQLKRTQFELMAMRQQEPPNDSQLPDGEPPNDSQLPDDDSKEMDTAYAKPKPWSKPKPTWYPVSIEAEDEVEALLEEEVEPDPEDTVYSKEMDTTGNGYYRTWKPEDDGLPVHAGVVAAWHMATQAAELTVHDIVDADTQAALRHNQARHIKRYGATGRAPATAPADRPYTNEQPIYDSQGLQL